VVAHGASFRSSVVDEERRGGACRYSLLLRRSPALSDLITVAVRPRRPADAKSRAKKGIGMPESFNGVINGEPYVGLARRAEMTMRSR
jgi:hypothetical protein